jgi:hypothetical protein
MTSEQGVRYRFGARERGGALAGWRAGQILTVAVGLIFGVLVLRWQPNVAGVAAALGILALYGALATVPVAGRTGDEWVPVAVCFEARRRGGASSGPMRTLRSLRLLQVEWHDMGVVHDRAARTLTAALSLRGRNFALLGADEQDRRVGAWASVLASAARDGSPVHRLQWLASSFPDDGRGIRSFLSEAATPAAPSASRASYESLLEVVGSHACTHDVLLALQVRQRSSVEAGCAALVREVGSLARLLGDADVVVEGVLAAADLARRFSRVYEPEPPQCARERRAGAFDGPSFDDASLDDVWPMAIEESWTSVRVDGLVHATFWVAEWPRTEVRSDFLAPLLLSPARATLSVVMEPLGPDAAVRKVESRRTADLADAELRRRGGFMSTARHARESEVLARREAELAEGHASFRFSGFVTVSAPDEGELALACDVIRHAAGQSRLALRRLYGDQASAFTCTLPLGRGLA